MRRLIPLTLMILHLVSNFHACQGLIGYDCGGAASNITTLSLLEVGECNIPQPNVNITQSYIQLIQINQFSEIKVVQCRIEIFRVIKICGMFSHTMDVLNGQSEYIDSVSRDLCHDMHRFGSTRIGKTEVNFLTSNTTTSRPVIIAGSIDADGRCQGTGYSDPWGTWDNAIVQGRVKITMKDYIARVDVDANKVHLPSGTSCDLSKTHCIDIDGSNTFWNPIPEDSCNGGKLGVLYEGKANRITDLNSEAEPTVYSLNEGDVTFALTIKGNMKKCGHTLQRTEHPKLFIVETSKSDPFIKKDPISVPNLDIFTYVNSKFVYVEKHMRTQIQQMYVDILKQQCHLERQMLLSSITNVKQSPDEFAYNVMKGPGYMGIPAGETIHIVKCVPISVLFKPTKECYNELPVRKGDKIYFLTPRTRILLRVGTQITCNLPTPPMYQIDGSWYYISQKAYPASTPPMLQPVTTPHWKYGSLVSLATSGIYSQQELDDLRNQIMFPIERPAILNSFARGISGTPTVIQGGTISNLFDEKTIGKIMDSAWEKAWGKFMTFSQISAGVIGIIIICKTIKFFIDTLIHGYALHTVYGWSIHLLGAVWDSLTNLLLHLSRRPPGPPKNNENEEGKTEKTNHKLETTEPPVYTKEEDPHEGRQAPLAPYPFHSQSPNFEMKTFKNYSTKPYTLSTPQPTRGQYLLPMNPIYVDINQLSLSHNETLEKSIDEDTPLVSNRPGTSATCKAGEKESTLYPELEKVEVIDQQLNEPNTANVTYFSLDRKAK